MYRKKIYIYFLFFSSKIISWQCFPAQCRSTGTAGTDTGLRSHCGGSPSQQCQLHVGYRDQPLHLPSGTHTSRRLQMRLRASFEVNIKFSMFWMGSWESSHLPKSELQHRAQETSPSPGDKGTTQLFRPITQHKLPILPSNRTVLHCLKPGKKETVHGDGISAQN